MDYCIECGFQSEDTFRTVYGEVLCEDCWDDYLCSKRGKVEYFVGICSGELPVEEFDADFLGSVAKSYMINHDKLELTREQKAALEERAIELGLL